MRLMTARSSTRRNRRGFGLPSCGLGRQRPDLDEAEAKREHLLGNLGILVEPRGETDRSWEVETGDPGRSK